MANSTADTPDVSETALAKMRIKDLREHARQRGIDGADDLHKPELLARVKDWHYARAHGGEHRPDAPPAVRNGKAGDSGKKGAKKAEDKKSEGRKSDGKKAEAKKADGKKADGKSGRNGDTRRTVAAIRRRLTQIEDALDDLEADLR